MNSYELMISENDYARLCRLPGGYDFFAELDKVIVIPTEQMPTGVVAMHSRVVYFDETFGARREIELVYPEEADPDAGRISVLAPVGSALLGLASGDFIDWKYPGGEVHRLHVERVTPRHEVVQPGRRRTTRMKGGRN